MHKNIILSLFTASISLAATRVSCATGNFTTAATWCTASTTANLDSEAATVQISTTDIDTATFVPANTAVDRVCFKVSARNSATGTLAVTLRNSTGASNAFTVTVNMTDIQSDGGGWQCVKNGSTHTPNGTDSYLIRAVCSASNCVTLFRDSTASNFSRQVVETTTGAPASTDQLIVAGEMTGAGTGNDITVTNDNTATTTFGTVSLAQSITVNKRAIWTNGTAASTAYRMRHAGIFKVWGGGTFNVGTSGTRIPATSRTIYDTNNTGNVDSGWVFATGSTVNIYGATIASTQTTLGADEAAAQTVISPIGSTSGWVATQELAFAPTTRTASEAEKKTILTVDSGTQVTLTAGLTNAHSGTTPATGEIVLLTRYAVFQGESASLQAYIIAEDTAIVNIDYAEFFNLGSATATKTGVYIATTTGTFAISNSALHDFEVTGSRGFDVASTSGNNITIATNSTFNIQDIHFLNTAGTGVQSVTGNVFIRSPGSYIAYIRDLGVTFTGNTITGAALAGVALIEANASPTGTFSMTVHSNNGCGIEFQSALAFGSTTTFTSITAWRNNGAGVCTLTSLSYFRWVVNGGSFFGNLLYNWHVSQVQSPWVLTMTNVTMSGDSSFATANGIRAVNSTGYGQVFLYSCDFGSASGIRVEHSVADIAYDNSNNYMDVTAFNTKLASTTPVLNLPGSTEDIRSFVKVQRFGQTAGDHRAWLYYGTARTDTVIFQTTSPSLRMTPTSASVKLEYGVMDSTVNNSGTTTWSVAIRKSSAGDGAEYNGAQPQLVILKNPAIGLTADSVCDTATVGFGAWETLTCTSPSATDNGVFSAVIRVDGTVGWVNVSDAVMTGPTAGHGEKYWQVAEPFPPRVGGAGAGSSGCSCVTVQ